MISSRSVYENIQLFTDERFHDCLAPEGLSRVKFNHEF